MYIILQKINDVVAESGNDYKILICKIIAHTQNMTIHLKVGMENTNMPQDDERSTRSKNLQPKKKKIWKSQYLQMKSLKIMLKSKDC